MIPDLTVSPQEFEAADSALPVFQLAAQSNDLGAQSVILVFEQLEFGAGRLAVARVHGAKDYFDSLTLAQPRIGHPSRL